MKRITGFFLQAIKSRKIFRILIFAGLLALYIISVRIALNFNNFRINDWRSELFADKGGYYIYLPATFIYGYYQSAYPEGIEYSMGQGFRFEDGKLFTKYPPGVAILVSPFFLAAHIMALNGQGPADGFSTVYYDIANYSSVFYLLLGCVFLFIFLRRRYSWWISLITVFFLVLGTNVYYYTFHEPLMSHVYSFAIFSLLLLLTDNLWKNPKWRNLLRVALVSGMVLLIRPVNLIFLLVIPLLDISSKKQFIERFQFLFKPVNLITIIITVVLVLSPQLVYWQFISGKLFYYSYQGESFKYWNNPQVHAVLHAAVNGLLPYTPGFVFIFIGFIIMIIRKERNRWMVPSLFIILLYMISSWHSYYFGCSFGQRSFVEYYPIFALPAASLFKLCYSRKNLVLSILVSIVFIYLFYFNIRLSNVYTKCYFGATWDYAPYRSYLNEAKIFPFQRNTFKWHNDFEERSYYSSMEKSIIKSSNAFNGEYVSILNDTSIYSCGFNASLYEVITGNLYKVEVQFECYFVEPPDETVLVCIVSEGTKNIFYGTYRLDDKPGSVPGSWIHYQHTFVIPNIHPRSFIKVYIWGIKGREVHIDNMDVELFSGEIPKE